MAVLHNQTYHYPYQGHFMDDNYDVSTIEFKSEANRLKTFTNWPLVSPHPRPTELAEAGWYYTGIDDRVKCPFCLGMLNKWRPTDSPFHEHKRHFPHCDFIRGLDVGNFPISRNSGSLCFVDPPQANTLFPSQQWDDVIRRPVACNDIEGQGGDLRTKEDRLRTFSRWPLNVNQKPEDLASAGFYYEPSEERPDRVRCAFCHIKLFNWQFMDDPWVEHAKWSPLCGFIRRLMGEDVVRDLAKSSERISAATVSQEVALSTPRAASEVPQNSIRRNDQNRLPEPSSTPSERPVQSSSSSPSGGYMQSHQVMAVLEMGFPKHLVQKAVEKCVRDRPGELPPAGTLGSIVMAMEEQQSTPASVTTSLTPLQRLKALQSGSLHPPKGANADPTPSESPVLLNYSITNQYPEAAGEGRTRERDNGSPALPEGTVRERDSLSHTLLSQRTIELREENDRLKDKFLCKICMEEKVRVTFMPCGHLACCSKCSMAVKICPICRSTIEGRLKTIF